MGDRLPVGISVRNGLWGGWEGLFGGLHAPARDEAPPKVNLFKAFLFTDVKAAVA
jgi:hypothetical protein